VVFVSDCLKEGIKKYDFGLRINEWLWIGVWYFLICIDCACLLIRQ
jgi:hypothetical protein